MTAFPQLTFQVRPDALTDSSFTSAGVVSTPRAATSAIRLNASTLFIRPPPFENVIEIQTAITIRFTRRFVEVVSQISEGPGTPSWSSSDACAGDGPYREIS